MVDKKSLRQLVDLEFPKVDLGIKCGGGGQGCVSLVQEITPRGSSSCLICTHLQEGTLSFSSEDHRHILGPLLEKEEPWYLCPLCLGVVKKLIALTEEVEDIKARIKAVRKLGRRTDFPRDDDVEEEESGNFFPMDVDITELPPSSSNGKRKKAVHHKKKVKIPRKVEKVEDVLLLNPATNDDDDDGQPTTAPLELECCEVLKSFPTPTPLKKRCTSTTSPKALKKGPPDVKMLPCPQCGKLFGKSSLLSRHLTRVHHLDSKMTCPSCPPKRYFKSLQIFQAHTHLEHEDRLVYTCPVCQLILKSMPSFLEHLGRHTKAKKNFQCYFCSRLLSNKDTFRVHMTSHTLEKPFSCTSCGKEFPTKSQCWVHSESVCSKIGAVMCHVCGGTFGTEKSLRSHFRTMHMAVKVQLDPGCLSCPQCGKTFKTSQTLTKHMKGVHALDPGNKEVCPICGRYFTSPEAFAAHTHPDPIRDPGKVVYTCSTCSKVFKTACDLKRHQRVVHEGGEVTQCADCGRMLKSKRNLINHSRSCSKKRGTTERDVPV